MIFLKVSKMLTFGKLLKTVWNPIKSSVRHNPYPVTFLHHLRNLPVTQTTQLPNGLTVATEERECYNACVGIYIDAGSRYESDFENGIAHFFEHIAFKNTRTRTRTVLEGQMSCTGARFKCFTTREMVAFYAECLCQDVPLVVDILSDCVFNNCLACSDIEHQKRIVYCEMLEQDHDVNTVLYDYLHATAFQGTTLGHTVVGPSCNLYNFNDETICNYLTKWFDPTRTVLAVVGGVTHDQVVCLANTYLCNLEPRKCLDEDVYRYSGSEVRFRNDSLPVGNVAIAVEGPCFCDEDNVVMDVAASLIGGWDRSQPAGGDHSNGIARAADLAHFCDSFKSFNINYKDTGLWGLQFMGKSKCMEDMLFTIQDQWMAMCCMITEGEVERARRELKTKLLTASESAVASCHDMGRWVLYNNYRPPLHERICAIDRVHAKKLMEICSKYVYDKCPAVAAVGATEGLPEYTRIRAGMYWLRI